jgi:hypothetical protein
MSPMINPNATGGAMPAQGNPQQGQVKPLPPEQIAALRKDPEIAQAVTKYMGRPFPLEKVPDQMLQTIAGMVFKLGVDGAVAEFSKMIPPQIAQRMKGEQ